MKINSIKLLGKSIFVISIAVLFIALNTKYSESGNLKTEKTRPNNYTNTIITSHLNQNIIQGKNIVYCLTFQLAWNELKNNIIKDNIRLQNEPGMVKILNRQLATKKDLSENSYIAMAGFGKDNILGKLNSALKYKFKNNAPIVSDAVAPESILAYAYLYKNLSFKYPFITYQKPLIFNSKARVNSFGVNKQSANGYNIRGQVSVFYYKNSNNFIIKLNPKNDKDEIVLAKLEPNGNLFEITKFVENKISTGREVALNKEDVLQIPKINFDIKHSYDELLNKFLLNKGFTDYRITKAIQNTSFKLDEKGSVLKSEAKIVLDNAISIKKESPKDLIFDRPFLVYLKEKQSKNPYLVIWIDNPELLIKN